MNEQLNFLNDEKEEQCVSKSYRVSVRIDIPVINIERADAPIDLIKKLAMAELHNITPDIFDIIEIQEYNDMGYEYGAVESLRGEYTHEDIIEASDNYDKIYEEAAYPPTKEE